MTKSIPFVIFLNNILFLFVESKKVLRNLLILIVTDCIFYSSNKDILSNNI